MNILRLMILVTLAFSTVLPVKAEEGPCTKDSRPDCERAVSFFRRVQTALARNDRAALAAMMEYPFLTSLDHKRVHIKTPNEFLSKFDEILDAAVRCEILNAREQDVWGNWQGYTVGEGAIWFDGVIPPNASIDTHAPDFWTKYPFKIKTVNNDSAYRCQASNRAKGQAPTN